MTEAAQCEQTIGRLRAQDDPEGTPLRRRFASREQRDWIELSRCYREALAIYRQFNKEEEALRLLASLLELVSLCDGSTSRLAIHLLLALTGLVDWLDRLQSGTQKQVQLALQRAIEMRLAEHEHDFWLVAAMAIRQTSEHRSGLEFLRDMVESDDERRVIDLRLCSEMQLAGQTCLMHNKWDGAWGWYEDAVAIARDRIGNAELTRVLLKRKSGIATMRAQRTPSPEFLQATRAETPSDPEYVEAMDQMSLPDSLNVIFRKGIEEQHSQRFLPSSQEFQLEYTSVPGDRLAVVLADERLLLDQSAIDSRVSLFRGKGLAGYINEGTFVDAQGNTRGPYCFRDRFVVQCVSEIAEVVGALLSVWRETGDLKESQAIAYLERRMQDYDWRIFEDGLSRYFQDDYVCATHLLVPQFENILRESVEIAGGSVKRMKQGVSGDALLNDLVSPSNLEVRALLGAGLVDLIYWYLVKSNGPFNFRNKISHGWIRPEEVDSAELASMTLWLTLKTVTALTSRA